MDLFDAVELQKQRHVENLNKSESRAWLEGSDTSIRCHNFPLALHTRNVGLALKGSKQRRKGLYGGCSRGSNKQNLFNNINKGLGAALEVEQVVI